jgi:hypothetical protein
LCSYGDSFNGATNKGIIPNKANDINRGKFAHVKVVEMLRGPKKIHIVRRWEWS